MVTHSALISNWFLDKRGLAMSISATGGSVGMIIILPLTQVLIDLMGWRLAYLMLAGFVLIVMIPLNLLFQKGKPEEIGLKAYGASGQDHQKVPGEKKGLIDTEHDEAWTIGKVLRFPIYWTLYATCIFSSFPFQMIVLHQAAALVDIGFSGIVAASILGLIGLSGVPGGIFYGIISDRSGRDIAYATGAFLTFIGVLFLILTKSPSQIWMIYLYAILFGFGQASVPSILPPLSADLFQGRNFGLIFGLLSSGFSIGGSVGSWLGGYLFDVTRSYTSPFILAMVSPLIGSLLIWITVRKKDRLAKRVVKPSKHVEKSKA